MDKDFNQIYSEVIEGRRELIMILNRLADDLNKHNRNGKIAKAVGIGIAIAGSIIGAAAAPLTGGGGICSSCDSRWKRCHNRECPDIWNVSCTRPH